MASSTGAPGAAEHARGSAGIELAGTSYHLIRRLDDPARAADGDEVWAARHQETGIEYAIKLLPLTLPGREQLVLRMQQVDARMQTGLSHKNLVRIFDIGVAADGRPYFVLEKLSGRTARDLLRDGPLPLARALEAIVAVCDALHAAHAAGAVHRRVRPEVLFVCDDWAVKLLGFGKILDLGTEGTIAPSRRSRADDPYIAPEVSSQGSPVDGSLPSRSVDGRADVYSVGAVLYELLTGKPPPSARPVSPPSAVAAQLVPPEVDALVVAALSADRERRPPTAGALAAELGSVLERIGAPPRARAPDPSDTPTRWDRAKQPGPSGEATAVFSLRNPVSQEAPNVYTIRPGSMLAGKYRVVRTIGKGGMGLVVEARHVHLDQRVAMKLLLPEFMSYAEASGRFLREARAASKLTSVHVARVLDVGTLEAGEPYMVMEYLAGEDLSYNAHARTPLAIGDAIEYLTQTCEAIGEAHELGIVHRDLKPANLFLTRRADGSPLVKVLDFGISKVLGEGERDIALTQTTTILGSALYMSPEQMQSAKRVDRRTDIYALGVCLFELIGREQPYFAESFPELCAKVFTSPPKSLRGLRPEVPEGLEQALEKALAREPDSRYQNVGELVRGLSPFARLDTRARMENILRRYHPHLRLLPPAPMATTRAVGAARAAPTPVGGRASNAATVPSFESNSDGRPRKRSRTPMIVAACTVALAGGLGWGALHGGATSDEAPAAPASIEAQSEAAPTASAAFVAPASEPTAPLPAAVPSASSSASASVAAPAAASAKPTPRPTAAPRGQPRTGSDEPGASPPTTPAPPVNTDLVQETCKARMPDGTEKIVPCH